MLFEAAYDYTPKDDGEIELKQGDRCYVKNPIANTEGWLDGVNYRSKESGQFPGTYCKIIEYDTQLPVPPRPQAKPVAEHRKTIINGHTLEKIVIIKPVWCSLCEEYIWGGGKISLICSGCFLCAHYGCHQNFSRMNCGEQVLSRRRTKADILKPVEEWSRDEVLEWMVAVHLHPYIHIIKKQNITGRELLQITIEHLQDWGIDFNLHGKIFVMCIEELRGGQPNISSPHIGQLKDNTNISTHVKLFEHSFTTFQKCDICDKAMFGVFRQGLMCAACGIQCHRSCAFASIRECNESYIRARRPSDSEDPSFCCNYNSKTIPAVLRKCVEAVERYGLNTPNVYTSYAPYEQVEALRSALNQDPLSVNMNDEYWSDPRCPAYVLKTFLIELPDPLLPFEEYDNFIALSNQDSSTAEQYGQIKMLLKGWQVSHLDYVMRHLIKMSKYNANNGMTLEKLSKIFSMYLIRPEDGEARVFIANLQSHQKVVHMLLCEASQSESHAIPDYDSEPWFWADATRKDISHRLHGTPDGSFLVRPSEERKGGWTLTVRKDGKDRLIRVIQRDGRCGFREDLLNFSNLKELVHHFSIHSLEDYNEKLNIKLTNPCGKPESNPEEDDALLTERYKEVDDMLKEIKLLEFQVEDQQRLLEECKIMSESQTDIVSFIDEQITLAQQQYNEASAQDRQDIQTSLTNLNDLLRQEKTVWQELDEKLMDLKQACNVLNTELTERSTELPNLQEEYNRIYQKMRDTNPTALREKESEDLKEIYDYLPNAAKLPTKKQHMEDLEEKYWLFPYKLERNEITRMLENKPNGTFFVRESANYPYVITLVHDNVIKHVPVLQGPNGYGFAEPHNIYRTLHELINHYHNQSLRMHNKNLDTTLQTPYRFLEHTGDEPIYE